jgi:peptidoglycan hydrolase-like protein with peptidoglycan-binding domain
MPNLSGTVVESSDLNALAFPGRIVERDDPDTNIVRSLQHRLNEVGCGPIDEDGGFGDQTESAVRLFQARFSDSDNQPLKIDGRVGSLSWGRLFGAETVPRVIQPATDLAQAVLDVARSQIGVREQPLGSNRGPEVDQYVRATGLNPSGRFPWCVCFAFFCFKQAAESLGRANPMIRTAGVLDLWNGAGNQGVPRVTTNQAMNNPALVHPGQIFVIDTPPPGGAGHAGLVEQVLSGKLVTIEGNTNDNGSREGIGVFRREQRKISSINKGFVDFTRS